ncbi:MAG: RNA methyltransferase [Balneolaceae bacterium]|nr:RNA methyltransferase [Balneolaceae bacterium]
MLRLSESQCTSWAKLHQRKVRKNMGQCLVEGWRSVSQVLQNGQLSVQKIIVSMDGGEGPSSQYMSSLQAWGITEDSVVMATPTQCKKLSDTPSAQTIFALVDIPEPWDVTRGLEGLSGQSQSLVLLLDDIQDPGNMGTILRSASWFGVDAVLCTPGCVDPWNSKVIRSLAGAIGVMPIGQVPYEWVESIPDSHAFYGLHVSDQALALDDVDWPSHTILAIGNEGNGLSELTQGALKSEIRIPSVYDSKYHSRSVEPSKPPSVESLNAAMAASIALYRYRQKP